MSTYTSNLSAEELIGYIANDYVELSHDKVLWQRNDYIKICREWLKHNSASEPSDTSTIDVSDLDYDF